MAGYEPGWLGPVQLVPTVVLLVTLAAAVDVALSDWAPGANDNASGVAVAVQLFDELKRDPPAILEPVLILTGAGHALPRAAGRYLGLPSERIMLLEVGPCGAGTPAWNARHPQVRGAAERAAAAQELPGKHHPRLPATRLPAVRIAALDDRGLTPRAHQPDDTEVDDATMDATLDLALGVVDALDADLEDPERRGILDRLAERARAVGDEQVAARLGDRLRAGGAIVHPQCLRVDGERRRVLLGEQRHELVSGQAVHVREHRRREQVEEAVRLAGANRVVPARRSP